MVLFRPFRPWKILWCEYLGLRSSDSLQPRLSYCGPSALAENGGRRAEVRASSRRLLLGWRAGDSSVQPLERAFQIGEAAFKLDFEGLSEQGAEILAGFQAARDQMASL